MRQLMLGAAPPDKQATKRLTKPATKAFGGQCCGGGIENGR